MYGPDLKDARVDGVLLEGHWFGAAAEILLDTLQAHLTILKRFPGTRTACQDGSESCEAFFLGLLPAGQNLSAANDAVVIQGVVEKLHKALEIEKQILEDPLKAGSLLQASIQELSVG